LSTHFTDDPQHWRDRAAKMRALEVKMAGSQAAILINDLAVHYDGLANQATLKEAALKEAALKGKPPPNGKRR
jgi:hypothetical protein